jgi:hypothetical protein
MVVTKKQQRRRRLILSLLGIAVLAVAAGLGLTYYSQSGTQLETHIYMTPQQLEQYVDANPTQAPSASYMFKNLTINAGQKNVRFRHGSENTITYANCEMVFENGDLTISSTEKPLFNFLNNSAEDLILITTTGPLESVTINSGDGFVKVNAIEIGDLNLTSEDGTIEFKNSSSAALTISSKHGDVTLDHVTLSQPSTVEVNDGKLTTQSITGELKVIKN